MVWNQSGADPDRQGDGQRIQQANGQGQNYQCNDRKTETRYAIDRPSQQKGARSCYANAYKPILFEPSENRESD